MAGRADFYRWLGNLAVPDPLAGLKALHEMRLIVRQELDAMFDVAELAQVRRARSMNPRRRWREIGAELGVSGQHAQRRFQDRLKP
jgi:hypothetical protein